MADFKINGVTFASESGGVVSLSNANVFPAGHVIQTVIKNQQIGGGTGTEGAANETVGNTATITSTFFNLSITTKCANSKIHLFAQSPYNYVQSGTGGEYWFNRNPTTDNIDINRPSGSDGDAALTYTTDAHGNPTSITSIDTPNVASGTTINYVVKFRRWYGSNSVYWVYDRGSQFGVFIIREIANG